MTKPKNRQKILTFFCKYVICINFCSKFQSRAKVVLSFELQEGEAMQAYIMLVYLFFSVLVFVVAEMIFEIRDMRKESRDRE